MAGFIVSSTDLLVGKHLVTVHEVGDEFFQVCVYNVFKWFNYNRNDSYWSVVVEAGYFVGF